MKYLKNVSEIQFDLSTETIRFMNYQSQTVLCLHVTRPENYCIERVTCRSGYSRPRDHKRDNRVFYFYVLAFIARLQISIKKPRKYERLFRTITPSDLWHLGLSDLPSNCVALRNKQSLTETKFINMMHEAISNKGYLYKPREGGYERGCFYYETAIANESHDSELTVFDAIAEELINDIFKHINVRGALHFNEHLELKVCYTSIKTPLYEPLFMFTQSKYTQIYERLLTHITQSDIFYVETQLQALGIERADPFHKRILSSKIHMHHFIRLVEHVYQFRDDLPLNKRALLLKSYMLSYNL